jgi:hypothetical protein
LADNSKFKSNEYSRDNLKASPGGYIILGLILLACVAAAYFLSIPPKAKVAPVNPIANAPTDSLPSNLPGQFNQADIALSAGAHEPITITDDQGVTSTLFSPDDVNPDDSSGITPPAGDNKFAEAQKAFLVEVSSAISSFRLSQGRYPSSIEELISQTSIAMPVNPCNPPSKVKFTDPSTYSACDFSYLPFSSKDDGSIDGFILIAYADKVENGVTIDDPATLVWPASVSPEFNTPIYGVSLAIHEGGNVIDLSSYEKSSNTQNEE